MKNEQTWPDRLWIVRHGQSAGNVAHDAAQVTGAHLLDRVERDADVPLSPLGERQALSLGRWFGEMLPEIRPTVVLVSPYVRARETASLVMRSADLNPTDVCYVIDERLREKEYGIIDRYTQAGIMQNFPDEAQRYVHLKKFYYRPPGGESWCDVILRLRSMMGTLSQEYCRERVLIVAHQVVVHCFRYLLEHMTEEQILSIAAEKDLANCSVTSYEFDPALAKGGRLGLRLYNFITPLEDDHTAVTRKPDVPAAPES